MSTSTHPDPDPDPDPDKASPTGTRGAVDGDAGADLLGVEPATSTGLLLGYGRVFTSNQSLDRQLDALTSAGCARIFTDTLSGIGVARPQLDALAQEALLALSIGWAFMISKDSAATYARGRADGHASRVEELARLLAHDRRGEAHRLVAQWPAPPFDHVDARSLT